MARIYIFLLLLASALALGSPAAAQSSGDSSARYATVYLYRPALRAMRLNKYEVQINDTIYTARNGSRMVLLVDREGPLVIRARSEVTRSVTIPVQFGKSYYIRCEVEAGIMKARPFFTLMDNLTGKAEYNSIEPKPGK